MLYGKSNIEKFPSIRSTVWYLDNWSTHLRLYCCRTMSVPIQALGLLYGINHWIEVLLTSTYCVLFRFGTFRLPSIPKIDKISTQSNVYPSTSLVLQDNVCPWGHNACMDKRCVYDKNHWIEVLLAPTFCVLSKFGTLRLPSIPKIDKISWWLVIFVGW